MYDVSSRSNPVPTTVKDVIQPRWAWPVWYFFLSVVCVYIHERSIWRDDNYIVGFADGVINYSWVWLYFFYIMYWKTNYWSLFMSITHFVRNSNYGLSHQCHIHVCIECAVVASHLWPVTHAHTCTCVWHTVICSDVAGLEVGACYEWANCFIVVESRRWRWRSSCVVDCLAIISNWHT